MTGKIYVQRCQNGDVFYMLFAGRYGKCFKSLEELREYAVYYKIALDPKIEEW